MLDVMPVTVLESVPERDGLTAGVAQDAPGGKCSGTSVACSTKTTAHR